MKYYLFLAAISFVFVSGCTTQRNKTVAFIEKEDDRRVDVLFDSKLFTSYIYPENVMKPVLWPIITSTGTEITRKYPLKKAEGERSDHPHHIGVWFNFGDVNGIDYWNHSEATPPEKKGKYGTIFHREVVKVETKKNIGTLAIKAEWIAGAVKHLDEETSLTFINNGDIRIIDRVTTLTANEDILFKDNKEGMFAIRVTSELELPSDEEITLTDSHGVPTEIKAKSTKATADYISSDGLNGEDVWGTRARWVKLFGNFGDEKVEVTIIDHPSNPGYPTYWHARGYGLFSANTLGQKPLSGGKDELNFSLKKGETATFKYRMVISSNATLDKEQLDELADQFATVK